MAFSSAPEAKSSHTTAFNRKTLSTVMCFIWQDDKRLSWFRSEWYKRPPRMYWYAALCICGLLYGCAGARLNRGCLWAALHPTFSCVTVLYKDLFVPEERSKKLFEFFAFSLVWMFACVCIHTCVCAFCLSTSLHYEKAKATNVICILFYGHSWSKVSGRSGW